MNSLASHNYACPSCGRILEQSAESLACLRCQHSFPLANGVIDFRTDPLKDHDYPLSREDMERLNAQFSTYSWQEIMGNFLEIPEDTPRWLDELVGDGRYAWRIFLNLRPGMTLLNTSGILGSSTANLAPYFKQTYTLNPSYQNAVFTRKRLGLTRPGDAVSVLVAQEDGQLPLMNGCIDIVFVDGLPKGGRQKDLPTNKKQSLSKRSWTDSLLSSGRRDGLRAQMAFLQDLSRVTSQDGSLFIRCSNRLNYKNIDDIFSRNPKGTTHLPVAGFFPNLLHRLRSTLRTTAYLHTIYGYRKLLKSAGFHYIDFVTFDLDDNGTEVIRPGPGNFPFWKPLSASSWKARIKQSPWIAPSFGIIARKRSPSLPRFEDDIVEKIVGKLGKRPDQFHTQHYLASAKGKLIVKTECDGDSIYVRLPLNEQAYAAESENHGRLEWLQTYRVELSGFFPHPVLKGCETGQHFFAESAVHGTPLLAVLKARRSAKEALKMGLNFLLKLNHGHLDTGTNFGKNDYDRFVSTPLASLSTFISPYEIQKLEGFFQDRLLGRKIPRGLLHGDYSAQNILTQDGQVTGLLDWEESVTNGIPALDAVCLTLSCLRRIERDVDASESLVDLARRKAYLGDYIESIEGYYEQTGTDPECHEALVLLYWISAIYHRVGLGRSLANTYDEQFVRKVVAQVLEAQSTAPEVHVSH